jgi:hypothetical protein
VTIGRVVAAILALAVRAFLTYDLHEGLDDALSSID